MKCLSFLTTRGDVFSISMPLSTSASVFDEQCTFEVLVPARLNTNGIAKSEHLKKAYRVSPSAIPRDLMSENFLMKKRKKYPELPFSRESKGTLTTTAGFFESVDAKDRDRDKDKEDLQSGRAGRAVEQFDLATGTMLRRYASMQEASVAMGQKPHYIAYHVFGKGATFSKSVFGWREVTLPPNPRVLKAGGLTSPVKANSMEGQLKCTTTSPAQKLSEEVATVGVDNAETCTSPSSGLACETDMRVSASLSSASATPTATGAASPSNNSRVDSCQHIDNMESEVDQTLPRNSAVVADVTVHPCEYEDISLLKKYMDRYMHRSAATVPSWRSFLAKVKADCLSDHDSDDNLELLKLKRMKSMGRVKDKNKDKQKTQDSITSIECPNENDPPLSVTGLPTKTKGVGSSFEEMSSSKWKKQQVENENITKSKLVATNISQGRKVLQQIDPLSGMILRSYRSGQEASKALGRQANYISYYIFGIGSRLHKSVFLWRRSWQWLDSSEETPEADIEALKTYMDRYTNKSRVPSWSSFLKKYEDNNLSEAEEEEEKKKPVPPEELLVKTKTSGQPQKVSSDTSLNSSFVDEVVSKPGKFNDISKLLVESLQVSLKSCCGVSV